MSKGRRPGDLSRRSRGPLLLAVLVPLSIAAVVLAVSLVRSHAGRSTPAQMPGSLAGPTAVFAGHPPPTDRPLIWFEPRAQRSPVAIQLRATDWELHAMGSLAIRCQQPCWMKASPDGQRLLVGEFPPEGRRPAVPDVVFDATGRRIGTVESGWQTTWADDSRHLCVLHVLDALTTPQPSKSRAQLDLVDPANAAPRIVGTVVGVNGPFIHEGVGIGYWDVPACSALTI